MNKKGLHAGGQASVQASSSSATQGAGNGLRQLVLWAALAVSISASVYTYLQESNGKGVDAVSEPTARAQSAEPTKPVFAAPTAEAVHVTENQLGTLKPTKTQVLLDPFAPLAVALPPPLPKPVAPVVAPPPSAPALPFQYAGKFEQPLPRSSAKAGASGGAQDARSAASQTVVYLTRGNDSYAVSPGENIDATYKFVGIEGESLVFMYLPLSTRQTLPIGP